MLTGLFGNLIFGIIARMFSEIILKSAREQCPGMQNVHFRFPSVAQKLRYLKLSMSS